MSKYVSFKGAVTELITPFTAAGEVDYELLRGEVEYQIKAGIAALFTNGLASEALSLTTDELIETTRVVVEAAKGRVPVMGNIACNTFMDGLTVLRGYEAAGVDAISIEQPCVYGFTQPALIEYFGDLCKATKLPVCIYNAPQTNNTLAPATVAKLFHENENLYYYKESTIDFVHIQNTMRLIGHDREMEFLNGSDATTYPVMLLGGKGVVSLISAVFPEPIIKLCNLMLEGKTPGSPRPAGLCAPNPRSSQVRPLRGGLQICFQPDRRAPGLHAQAPGRALRCGQGQDQGQPHQAGPHPVENRERRGYNRTA